MPNTMQSRHGHESGAPGEPARASGVGTVTSVRQVYELLRSGIFDGLYAEGYKFDELTMMRRIPSTRAALRGALGMLADEGLVIRRQASGTVVARGMLPIPVHQFLGPTGDGPILRDVQYEDLSYRKVSTPELIRRGLGTTDDEIVCYERLVIVAGTPVELRMSYYPLVDDTEIPPAFVKHWEVMPDFETRFASAFGHAFKHSHVTISSITGDQRTCRALQVPEGSPLLMRTLRLIDAAERVREIAFSYHPGDRATFVA
ncbi:MAG: GntR family transcriptional regulator [Nocardioidaceae bacterium]